MILLRLFICFIAVNFIVGASGSQFGVLESSDNQIDWANLTASSLGTIDPTQFSTITLSQLQSIPAQVRAYSKTPSTILRFSPFADG